jgi:hypothetical protein
MTHSKSFIVVLVTLIIGFGAGFVLRPVIAPSGQTTVAASQAPTAPAPAAQRGTQYFVAHIDEARQVVAGCRDGSVRGGECATAEEAIIKVEAQERRKRFLGN